MPIDNTSGNLGTSNLPTGATAVGSAIGWLTTGTGPPDKFFNDWLNSKANSSTRADQKTAMLAAWGNLTAAQKSAWVTAMANGDASLRTPQQVLAYLQSPPAATSTATATPSATSPAGEQQSATTAAQQVTGTLTEKTNLGPSAEEGIPVPGVPSGSSQQGFNELLSSYYNQQFAAAGTNATALATLAGTDAATLQSQYQSYTNAFQSAQASAAHPEWGQGGAPHNPTAPMTLAQFAQSKATSTIGPWASVLAAIDGIWTSQMGEPMPAALATQIVSALNAMPQDQQSNVLYNAYEYMTNAASAQSNGALFDQSGTYAAAILNSLPSSILTYTAGTGTGTGSLGTGGIVGTYAQTYPSALIQGETIEQTIAADFQKALNRAPTAADLTALGDDPSPTAIQNYINEQPVQGMNMTYGQLTAVTSNMTSLWQQYFGTAPTTAELQWGVGKTPAQLQDFVDNSPSAVPGVTIGRYNDYTTFLNSIDTSNATTHAFSGQVDASLISELHNNLQSQATGTAHPATES
jgi:hypothetical protein